MDKKHCVGCRDDFYNGKNPYGIPECWCLKTANLEMRKEVHVNQVPPWMQPAKLLPSCYRAPGYVYVNPEVTN